MNSKNVLIVEEASSGKCLAGELKKKGYTPYYLDLKYEDFKNTLNLLYKKVKIDNEKYEECFYMDGSLDEVIAKLKPYNFVAVMPGNDFGVMSANIIARKLGLPYNGGDNVYKLRSKFEMHEQLKKANLNYIQSYLAKDEEDAARWFVNSNFNTVVIKPKLDASSRNVFYCSNETEVKNAYKEISEGNNNKVEDSIVLQEFVVGKETVINFISRDGDKILTDIWDYDKIEIDGHPIYNCTWLRRGIDRDHQEAVEYVSKVLDVLDIKWGAAHAEVMLTNNGPVLIEVGARLMGGGIYPYLSEELKKAYPIRLKIESYLEGEKHNQNKKNLENYSFDKSICWKGLISYNEGKILKITAEENIKKLPTFKNLNITPNKNNMYLNKTKNLMTLCGDVLLVGNEDQIKKDYEILKNYEINEFEKLFIMDRN